jgi:hypothetical protein
MKKNCSACSRKISTGKYCLYHSQALSDLKDHYKTWIKAYNENILWNNFLSKLYTMDETGIWIKEVILVELNGTTYVNKKRIKR